jgi:carbon-monoxide dehydrogenase medium subunit
LKPAGFEYHAPEAVAEAASLLAEHGDDAKVLAGGQSLVPLLAMRLTRFEHLVDLGRIPELRGIDRANGSLVVRGMTTQRTAERSDMVAEAVPMLAAALPFIGHFQIRNRGTVGGSIAHADPASELPAVALALDAEMEVVSASGTRRIPAKDFFVGTWTTSAEPDEILAAVHFPVWEGRCGFAVDEVARRAGDFALVGAVAGVRLGGDGTVEQACVALFGMGATPERASATESAVAGRAPNADELAEAGRLAVAGLEPTADVHATAEYRSSVGAHLVERVLARAIEQAGSTA